MSISKNGSIVVAASTLLTRKQLAGLFAMTMAATASAQAVYRCEGSGSVVFQDRPCEGASVEDNQVEVRESTRGLGGYHDMDLARQADLRRAAESRQVMIGMTPGQVRRAWDSPTTIHESSGGREQWVYRDGPGSAQYVYFEDGLVDGWN